LALLKLVSLLVYIIVILDCTSEVINQIAKMKISLIVAYIFVSICFAFSQQNPVFDPDLAAKYKADDYGMKTYTFVLLQTGDTIIEDMEQVSLLFRGHMENISRQATLGKLIIAGPYGKNDLHWRGLYVFDLEEGEDIQAILDQDPAIKAGLLKPIVVPWYGSAALPAYLEVHQKIAKTNP
jgi:uncharacterized protein YciI